MQRPSDPSPAGDGPSASPRIYRPDDDAGLRPVAPHGDTDTTPGPAVAAVHAALRAFVEHDAYPCVGAKAALNHGSYRIGFYDAPAAPASSDDTPGDNALAASAADLVADLRWFGSHAESIHDRFATFVSVFTGAATPESDEAFETRLWALLRRMHAIDSNGSAWDPAVSDDPADPDFSFSIGGHAFFVIGMHPRATREARRFCYPIVVWNLHEQFERLRAEGRFEPMRDTIREREESLAGSPNPALADHGERSEALQYAGVPHPPGWTPDFEAERHHAGGRHESSSDAGAERAASEEIATRANNPTQHAPARCPFHAGRAGVRSNTQNAADHANENGAKP